ncbi:FtsX-like permease family protein [Candidatus Pelagibacter communis]|uniref:FtsX-like permease family protein n=1 Tax=Pelagibacter ubique TaxID=198252 RepID=UPI00094C95CA|nr:FtsX-like permease family protein [Candidatus Pelagibacter ubique]
MISKLEKEITFRYLKTRKKDGFLNIITIFSFIGISLGVAVLIIVMSVMNGFRSDLIKKINGFNSHATIQNYDGLFDLKKINSSNLKSQIDGFLISNNGEGIIINEKITKGVLLRGYKKEEFQTLNIVKNQDFSGSKVLGNSEISISRELGYDLDLKIGDKLSLVFSSFEETLIGSLPKQKTFKISSFYNSGFNDFDKNIAFVNIEDLENQLNLTPDTRFLEIYFKDPTDISKIKKDLIKFFPNDLIYTWSDLNKPLFSALKVERNVMFIILSLIIIVAAFNIISGLTILVKNKTREIAIMKSIGVKNGSIRKIFFMVGFIIGCSATIFGVILGIIFSVYIENIRQFISNLFNITLFPEEIYFLSTMPYELDYKSIILISICSIISTCLVSLFPAIKASNLDTIKSLKYE